MSVISAKRRSDFLDACAARQTHVHADLTTVDTRKEVAPDEREENERKRDEHTEGASDQSAMAECPVEPASVPLSQILEVMNEPTVDAPNDVGVLVDARVTLVAVGVKLGFALEQHVDRRRHQGAAQEVAHEHGEDDRHSERREQVLRSACNEGHRYEDDADRQRRHERGAAIC